MKLKLLLCGLFLSPLTLLAQPSDAVHPKWKNEVPEVVYPDSDLVHLYNEAWRIAADRVRKGPKGTPASPYLDENCYDDQIWIWDTCFMVMFSRYAPAAFPGKQSLFNLYVPILENRPTPLKIHLRDNPPIFPWVEYDNYVMTADTAHIHRVLEEKEYLQRHFRFFNEVPKGNMQPGVSPQGIYRDVVKKADGSIDGFIWTSGASGMDNTPRGREAGGNSKILWVDAISQQALSALYISRLCNLRGNKQEARYWSDIYEKLKLHINKTYWDKRDGFYYDVTIADHQPCRVKTVASFWPLLAEVASKKQAKQMVEQLKDSTGFGGERPWVSLARTDKDYNAATGDYWRGGIWLPMVYMGTKALEKYGYTQLADELAERVVRQQVRTYRKVSPHTIWECYSPSADAPSTEHGHQARPDFCGWSALGPISLFIENIMGFRRIDAVHHQIVWDIKPQNGTHGLRHLKFGDTTADLIYYADRHQIEVKTNVAFTLCVSGHTMVVKAGNTTLNVPKL